MKLAMLDSRKQSVRTQFMTRFIVFIAVVATVLGAIHYYLWLRLVRAAHWPPPWNIVLAGFLVLATVGMPASMLFARGRGHTVAGQVFAWVGFTWLGVMFLLLVAVLGVDAVRMVVAIARRIS